MTNSTCTTDNCGKRSSRSGMCVTHYRHALESGIHGKRIPCRWEPCEKFASTSDYCMNHYAKAKRQPGNETPWIKVVLPCEWPDCERSNESSGYCNMHYQRAWKLGNFDQPWVEYEVAQAVRNAPKVCRWPGCNEKPHDIGFCGRDASRARTLGNLVDPWNGWVTSGECEVCGKKWESGRNRNRIVCSRTCRAKRWSLANPEAARKLKMDAVRRRRARLANVHVEMFSMDDVRQFKGDDCYICNKPIDYDLRFPDPGSPSIDHVVPISLGGSHTIENVAMTHLTCNLRKGTSPAAEFV